MFDSKLWRVDDLLERDYSYRKIEIKGQRNGKKMIKLIIADDDFKVRSAINLLLQQDKTCWHVSSEVKNVKELFSKVIEEKPQLLLLDWELPEENNENNSRTNYSLRDRIKYLKKINPGMYIIVLSSEPSVKVDAVTAGADRFVSKGDPPECFLQALYEICDDPIMRKLKKRINQKIEDRGLDKILI